MQSVSAAFTAEEKDSVRKIAHNVQVSWKKDSTLGNKTFTIGVSTIGGNDIIGINPGAIGSPGNYRYFDESDYVMGMSWERGLNMPTGGLTKALAQVDLDNTSGRFTPRYMGGNSELYTAQPLRSPFIINAGFDIPPENVIPQFAGLITEQPEINKRYGTYRFRGADYIDYFENKYLDHEVMSTAQRTDLVMGSLLQSMGMNTAQYDLDTGINIIPFVYFPVGAQMANIFHELAEAENGHFYQDESGIFKFENRQHWDSSPYTQVQRVVLTGQVLNAEAPNDDHLINVVEIRGQPRTKQPRQLLFQLSEPIFISSAERKEVFVDFDDPVLEVDTINFESNLVADGSGADASAYLFDYDVFAKSAKLIFKSSTNAFITSLDIFGRPAKVLNDLYYRAQDDSSVTAYQERSYQIDNDFISDISWAGSYAQMILGDYSNLESIQNITIRALPELQLGDLVSWQGRYWRVFHIRSILDPSEGFLQELSILQRTTATYFRIGISTIGGTDKIAP